MYEISIENLVSQSENIKSIIRSSFEMNVIHFKCREQCRWPIGETIFCCEKKYIKNRLEAYIVLSTWFQHDNQGWDISKSDEYTADFLLHYDTIPRLRALNCNFVDYEWCLEAVSESKLNHTNQWKSNEYVGEIILNGVAHEVLDYGQSFKEMLGEPKNCTIVTGNRSYGEYFYETNNYYVIHDFWESA